MTLEMAALTHRGMVRKRNEDALYFDVHDRLAIVCDGMGGHCGGQVASELAVQVIASGLRTLRPHDWLSEDRVVENLKNAVFAANDHILSRAKVDPSLFDMGTTLAACAFMLDRVVTVNVGDSRVYRINDGVIQQISEDHSLVAERIKAGELAAGSPEARMLSNILTRALGMEAVTMDITVEDLRPHDNYLLCTDGLSDLVRNEEFAQIATETPDVHMACMRLIDLANARGGHDNITAALIRNC